MGSYDVVWKSSAEKDLYRLDRQYVPRMTRAVEALSQNPFPPQVVKIEKSEHMYRLRVGDYRIVYEVNTKSRTLTIHYIRHRKDVYRRL